MPWVPRDVYERLARQAGKADILEQVLADCRRDLESLKAEMGQDRARANTAVDELLAVRGMAPVTPPVEPTVRSENVLGEPEAEVEKLEQAMRERGFGAVLMERG